MGAECPHADREPVGRCRDCDRPICSVCALPSGDGLFCPGCQASREAAGVRPLAGPLPVVLGWVALGTAAASLVHGAYLVPALAAGAGALAWGLWRHLGLADGRPAGRAILAWALGAAGLALCGAKLHLYGPGFAGLAGS